MSNIGSCLHPRVSNFKYTMDDVDPIVGENEKKFSSKEDFTKKHVIVTSREKPIDQTHKTQWYANERTEVVGESGIQLFRKQLSVEYDDADHPNYDCSSSEGSRQYNDNVYNELYYSPANLRRLNQSSTEGVDSHVYEPMESFVNLRLKPTSINEDVRSKPMQKCERSACSCKKVAIPSVLSFLFLVVVSTSALYIWREVSETNTVNALEMVDKLNFTLSHYQKRVEHLENVSQSSNNDNALNTLIDNLLMREKKLNITLLGYEKRMEYMERVILNQNETLNTLIDRLSTREAFINLTLFQYEKRIEYIENITLIVNMTLDTLIGNIYVREDIINSSVSQNERKIEYIENIFLNENDTLNTLIDREKELNHTLLRYKKRMEKVESLILNENDTLTDNIHIREKSLNSTLLQHQERIEYIEHDIQHKFDILDNLIVSFRIMQNNLTFISSQNERRIEHMGNAILNNSDHFIIREKNLNSTLREYEKRVEYMETILYQNDNLGTMMNIFRILQVTFNSLTYNKISLQPFYGSLLYRIDRLLYQNINSELIVLRNCLRSKLYVMSNNLTSILSLRKDYYVFTFGERIRHINEWSGGKMIVPNLNNEEEIQKFEEMIQIQIANIEKHRVNKYVTEINDQGRENLLTRVKTMFNVTDSLFGWKTSLYESLNMERYYDMNFLNKEYKFNETEKSNTIKLIKFDAVHLLRKIVDMIHDVRNKKYSEVQVISNQARIYLKEIMKSLSQDLTIDDSSKQQLVRLVNICSNIIEYFSILFRNIQGYERDQLFFKNLQDINEGKQQSSLSIELNVLTRMNLILLYYHDALRNLKLMEFPFNQCKPNVADTPEQYMRNLKDMISCIRINKYTLNKADKRIMNSEFSLGSINGPFYSWKNISNELEALFRGDPIFMDADINYKNKKEAIKFTSIYLNFTETSGQQKTLDSTLSMFYIRLEHSGYSQYYYQQKHTTILSETLKLSYKYGNPFRNTEWIEYEQGDVFLSPYTTWKIQLYGGNKDDFNRLKIFSSTVNLHLSGNGWYILQNS